MSSDLSSSLKTIAFFGATGGCAGHALNLALQNGYTCTALARTPSKLTNSLQQKGLNIETIETKLHIIQGNVKDLEAVKQTITGADVIVSGIGGAPVFQWSLFKPFTLDDPRICSEGGSIIMAAAKEIGRIKKPIFVNISTTGLSRHIIPNQAEDVPFWYRYLYHYILQEPHEDKRILEAKLREEGEESFRAYVNVKPTLLFDGESRGIGAIREGKDDNPALGYVMNRKDVGVWIFERTIKEDLKEEFWGRGVSLAY